VKRPIKVADLELSGPIAGLTGLDDHESARLLVRLDGSPLGWTTVPVVNGHCDARTLVAAVRRDLLEPLVRELVHRRPGAAHGRCIGHRAAARLRAAEREAHALSRFCGCVHAQSPRRSRAVPRCHWPNVGAGVRGARHRQRAIKRRDREARARAVSPGTVCPRAATGPRLGSQPRDSRITRRDHRIHRRRCDRGPGLGRRHRRSSSPVRRVCTR
jgi:hypothetical protein